MIEDCTCAHWQQSALSDPLSGTGPRGKKAMTRIALLTRFARYITTFFYGNVQFSVSVFATNVQDLGKHILVQIYKVRSELNNW